MAIFPGILNFRKRNHDSRVASSRCCLLLRTRWDIQGCVPLWELTADKIHGGTLYSHGTKSISVYMWGPDHGVHCSHIS